MKTPLRYLKKIINSGISPHLPGNQCRRIKLTNLLAFTIALITYPYVLIFSLAGSWVLGVMVLPIATGFLVVIALNYLRLSNASRNLFMLIPNIAVTSYATACGEPAGIQLYFFANACIPLVILDPENRLKIVFGSIVPLALYIVFIGVISPNQPWVALDPWTLRIIHLTMIISTYGTIFAALLYLYVSNYKSEISLQESVQSLQQKIGENQLKTIEVARHEAQLRSIFDSADDAIFLLDINHKYLAINKGTEKFGFTVETVIGKDATELIGEVNGNVYIKMQQYVIDTKKTFQHQGQFQTLSGSKMWISMFLSPVIETSGKVVGISGIVRDISNDIKIREELIEAKNQAESANATKTNFLAMVSHELRTPLSVIIGNTELLETSSELTESNYRASLNAIQRNGQDLLGLIERILSLSTIEAGRLEIKIEKIDVVSVTERVLEMFTEKTSQKGLQLKLIVSDSLHAVIETDPIRLRQILINLISNAIKFTNTGTITCTLGTGTNAPDGSTYIDFEVADTGIGMPESMRSKLFQPFNQENTFISRKSGGTGLGLYLSKSIAKALNGDLFLKNSAPTQGSSFVLRLPLSTNTSISISDSVSGLSGAPTNASANNRLESKYILLVEDNEDLRLLFSGLLTAAGATVETAADGPIAVSKAKDGNFDLILMDIQLPTLDGYNATIQIRKNGYKKPVIALTAHALNDEIDRCLAAGCQDYLSKPLPSEKLISTVLKWVTK